MQRPAMRRLPIRHATAVALGVAALALASCADAGAPRATAGIRLTPFVRGLDHPVNVAIAPGERRIYVVEQPGRIRVIENGALRPEPFLDLTAQVRYGGERGLLGLAFHPRYAENGLLFVNYTDRNGDTRVVRLHAAAARRSADPASAHEILFQKQPYPNHNGGHLVFGPDGMLYVGLGDGGSGGDPGNRAQDLSTWLGKLLRIDVDHGDPYAVPRDNPFVGRPGVKPEIWAYGLRNPWRFAFDAAPGLLYIADVGQDRWEEIDVVPATRAGLDFGWRLMEGSHPFKPDGAAHPDLVSPVLEYGHDEGCSITGGAVYRGRHIPALAGAYLYSDYCQGWLRSFRFANGAAKDQRRWDVRTPGAVTSFGTDADDEMLVVAYDGTIYRIDPAAR